MDSDERIRDNKYMKKDKNSSNAQESVIMGLDPGTFKMGYGLISMTSSGLKHIHSGTFESHKKTVGERLLELNQQLTEVFKKYHIDHVALEKMFLGKDPTSAFKIGQAFGMGCSEAYRHSCQVFEYDVRFIKKSVTGLGSASKESVAYTIQNILEINEPIKHLDQSDALAVAVCHAYFCQNQETNRRLYAGGSSC